MRSSSKRRGAVAIAARRAATWSARCVDRGGQGTDRQREHGEDAPRERLSQDEDARSGSSLNAAHNETRS